MRTSSAKPNFLPFLSTPSARRATSVLLFGVQQVLISIHALREEGDHPYSSWERGSNEFLSTPSARRATIPRPHLLCWHHDFYPRPPRGGRRRAAGVVPPVGLFLSTPSARRATFCGGSGGSGWPISIHALREEGDPLQSPPCALLSNFYPRPPRGGRRVPRTRRPQPVHFYPRPPRGGRPATALHRGKAAVFYPRPPRGGRPSGGFAMGYVTKFLSTPSARRATCFSTKISPIF